MFDYSELNVGRTVQGGALAAIVSAGVGIAVTVTVSKPAYNWIGKPIATRIANRWKCDETKAARMVTVSIIGASGGTASGATSGAIGGILAFIAKFSVIECGIKSAIGTPATRYLTAGILWMITKRGVIIGGSIGLGIGLLIGSISAARSNNNYVPQVAVRHGNRIAGVVSAILTAIMVSYTVV